MRRLPIDEKLSEIVDTVDQAKRLVLIAPPGAGKTTRVAPALARSGRLAKDRSRVVLLQPRRIAARAVAARMAEENGWTLGEEVGYRVRFDRRDGPRSVVQVLTEGILTQRMIDDPFLENVGAVILDEFHERSVHADLALALLREIQEGGREDLIVIVMSATLAAEPVARFLGSCPIIQIQGRAFPVDIVYRPQVRVDRHSLPEEIRQVVVEALQASDDPGDFLVFLPGKDEIRRTAHRLEPLRDSFHLNVLPLHGSLSAERQDLVFRPSEARKIILTTNVAETSITVEGIGTVIDSGLARIPRLDHRRGIDRLELTRISRASAAQRAGRAGRTRSGRCYRLWSLRDERGMLEAETPEIHRIDLSGALLLLHACGSTDPSRFSWFDPPPIESIRAAESLLTMLGALDQGRPTPTGLDLLRMPVSPRLARLLVSAARVGLLREGATFAALLSEKDIFRIDPSLGNISPSRTLRGRSDPLDRLDLIEDLSKHPNSSIVRDLLRVRDDLEKHARRFQDLAKGEIDQRDDRLLQLLLLAYPDRVCRRRAPASDKGTMVGGRGVRLEPRSVVRDAEFFLALDPREDRKEGTLEAKVSIASAIDEAWLESNFPNLIRHEKDLRFDPDRERVVEVETTRYLDLVLRETVRTSVDAEAAAPILAEALADRAEEIVRSDEEAARVFNRIAFLRLSMPEWNWPQNDNDIAIELLRRACVGMRSLSEIRSIQFASLLIGLLDPTQARVLRENAPETIEVPSGRKHPLLYEPGRPPILAVRVQELFGWIETPRLAQGRVPLLLHLLGPNDRPVQITNDLRSFWQTTYFQVRKDLRSRYPKHSWPEDPLQAKAEAKGSRRSRDRG